jgi:hypothetical protein
MTAAGAWQALAGQADMPALRMPLGITNQRAGLNCAAITLLNRHPQSTVR